MKKLVALLALLLASQTFAQDRHFAWSYNTPTLPAGNVDIEAWNTFSSGRNDYFYSRLHQRIEFEIGLADGIQTSLYLNAKHSSIGPRATDATTALQRSSSFSFSNAWKFALLNPATHTVGMSAYAEYYLAQGEIELEGKLMFDHMSENHWFVLNSTFEVEFENEFERDGNTIETETEKEYSWETTLGYMYNISHRFGLGFEVRNINAMKSEWEYSALFAGPSIFLGAEKYFLIFNVMPQIANLKGPHTPLELDAQERFLFRALLGVSL